MAKALPIVDVNDVPDQFDAEGKPKRPFTVHKGAWLSMSRMLGVTSMAGVVLSQHAVLECPPTLTTLDGLICHDQVFIKGYNHLLTLGNVVLGGRCRMTGLMKVKQLGTPKCGPHCKLFELYDPVDLGTPTLTASEMQIVRQINTRKCSMSMWHYEKHGCGTVHCLAGWAEAIYTGKVDCPSDDFTDSDYTADIGNKLLPNLSHLFYAADASESVRRMLKRLQALPE